ncbi:hypothetical protein F5X99DRAFT_420329 [Biscogniauxia marginata]|nr:hypothetical protein F5X99DRAFT_420329 [Biscogniauxia marginata]
MPRFPVNFRRKSTAAEDHNAPVVEPSFRVLDRSDASNGKSFDGGHRLARLAANSSKSNLHEVVTEDNLFVGMKNNRWLALALCNLLIVASGSGSSTTKTASDNSSRHSNASTAPSSTDYTTHEDWRHSNSRKSVHMNDAPPPPAHKHSSTFLKQAGRTFSFGGNKKSTLPTIPAEEPVPPMPDYSSETTAGRSRAETASTVSTATPPKVEDRDFMLDLGGDLASMLNKFDKRSSVATLKERNLTAVRTNQPAPLHLDHSAPVEPPQHSWNSQTSNDGLLGSRRAHAYHYDDATVAPVPPLVPKHETNPTGRRVSLEDDEDTTLLQDSIAATQYLSDAALEDGSTSRHYRRDDARTSNPRKGLTETYAMPPHFEEDQDDDNMFEKSFGHPSRVVPRIGGRSNSQPQNKVMTPEEFEKYRRDKVQEERMGLIEKDDSEKEEEDNYDDEEDDLEKSKQMAKQRRKQEAHMTVYRQQMMKVTGESSTNTANPRASIAMSMSTPNLPFNAQSKATNPSPPSDAGSDEDEEIPLAILAAHGFPNKNRPPTRISKVPSNPNLRASMQPSYNARPASAAGDNGTQSGANGGHLPPFARKLPQDPYLGAGLIHQTPREPLALGGGMSISSQSRAVPTGGLVGVIANEERSRALRRGSPAVDGTSTPLPSMQMNGMPMNGMQMNGGFDPMAGIPPHMMYPMGMPQMPGTMMTPTDQAQLQMSQQMTQFMQMQMQFMQMMASNNQAQGQGQGPPRGTGHMPSQSMGSLDRPRNSFLGDPMAAGGMRSSMNLELPRFDSTRTMSMVQPSSSSWLPQQSQPGYAPSIRAQGGGYAPSIAPSERSNIGLPGRYRPVSSIMPLEQSGRTSTMSGALPVLHAKLQQEKRSSTGAKDDDDDDEEGWEAMKAKREKKKSIWRSKKDFGSDIGALIS